MSAATSGNCHFSDVTAGLRNVCCWGKSGVVIASPDFRVC